MELAGAAATGAVVTWYGTSYFERQRCIEQIAAAQLDAISTGRAQEKAEILENLRASLKPVVDYEAYLRTNDCLPTDTTAQDAFSACWKKYGDKAETEEKERRNKELKAGPSAASASKYDFQQAVAAKVREKCFSVNSSLKESFVKWLESGAQCLNTKKLNFQFDIPEASYKQECVLGQCFH